MRAVTTPTLALFARQALIVSYIVLGMLLGPWGLGLVTDPQMISGISQTIACDECGALYEILTE